MGFRKVNASGQRWIKIFTINTKDIFFNAAHGSNSADANIQQSIIFILFYNGLCIWWVSIVVYVSRQEMPEFYTEFNINDEHFF